LKLIKMDDNTKNLVLWIAIAILAILVVYVLFFQESTGSSVIGPATQAARTSSSGMVGGC
jgi:hypothetical protein